MGDFYLEVKPAYADLDAVVEAKKVWNDVKTHQVAGKKLYVTFAVEGLSFPQTRLEVLKPTDLGTYLDAEIAQLNTYETERRQGLKDTL